MAFKHIVYKKDNIGAACSVYCTIYECSDTAFMHSAELTTDLNIAQ